MLTTPGGRPASRQIPAKANAVSGVNSAGLSTTVLPMARAGRDLPGQHEQREVPGDDLPRDAHGHVSGQLALHELGPAGVVVEVPGHEGDVQVPRLADGLAVVQGLEHGEQAGVLLDVAGQGVEVAGAAVAAQLPPDCDWAARAASTAASTSAAPHWATRARG